MCFYSTSIHFNQVLGIGDVTVLATSASDLNGMSQTVYGFDYDMFHVKKKKERTSLSVFAQVSSKNLYRLGCQAARRDFMLPLFLSHQ